MPDNTSDPDAADPAGADRSGADPDIADPLGAEISATMRAHEQPGSVERIIAALRTETPDRDRRVRERPTREHRRRRSAVLLSAAAVTVLAGVTGLVVAANSDRAKVSPVAPPSAGALSTPSQSAARSTALAADVVRPGDRVTAVGLGGIVTAGSGSYELCSLFIGAGTSQSPGPSDGGDRPGLGCEALGGIMIATVMPSRPFAFATDLGTPTQVTGTYRVDGSISVDTVRTAPSGEPADTEAMTTPCPTPAGGWKRSKGDTSALNTFLGEHPDEYLSRGTRPEGKDYGVTTVGTLTRDLGATRVELEKIYGAPVCVYRATHSRQQLEDATSAANSVLRSQGAYLYSGRTNTTSSSLPLNSQSDTSVGYVRIITPALAQQLAPFGELITFLPFIRPLADGAKSEVPSTSASTTDTEPSISAADSEPPSSVATSPAPVGPAGPSGAALVLPTFTRPSDNVRPEALAQGVLTRDRDGCLRLGPDGPVAIWPSGYSAVLDASGGVTVLDAGGQGAVVRTGQYLVATGGSFESPPAGCRSATGTFRVYLAEVKG